MRKSSRINFKHVLLLMLLAFALILSYLAGTISVEAGWFRQDENRATTNQIAAVSAVVSLLLTGNGQEDILFLPVIIR
jgi:hypothetical protein